MALVSGEAGIGKSSLMERFVATLTSGVAARETRVAVGRAVGYLQGAPPYLAILSALEALATIRLEQGTRSFERHRHLLAVLPVTATRSTSPDVAAFDREALHERAQDSVPRFDHHGRIASTIMSIVTTDVLNLPRT